MKKRQSKDPLSTVSQPRRRHKVKTDLDSYPGINDWFEAVIVAVALFGIGGGALGLYVISKGIQ